MTRQHLIMSIRPKYAVMVKNGTKTVEFRRVKPKGGKGCVVLLYESSPIQALIGYFRIHTIITGSPIDIWELVRGRAAITYEEFLDYYQGVNEGVALVFKKFRAFEKPLPLQVLRKHLEGFQPPRSYRYLTLCQIRKIDRLAGNANLCPRNGKENNQIKEDNIIITPKVK